jgi:tetratricopeptide (TPR) repeat protein
MMMASQSRLLCEAGGIKVFHRPGRSSWTLVVFGPRQEAPHAEGWWGIRLGRREDIDIIGVAPTGFDWFPRDTMAALLPAIRAAARPGIVTYGFSMGGYGALKYANALGARGVLALSAQYSIDPADGTTGERGTTYFDPVRHRDMRIAPGDYPDGALLMWDPEARSDDNHCRVLARLPGIRPVLLRLAGHATSAIFAETGRLMPVAEALLAGRPEDAVAGIRAARREAPTVLFAAAALLDAHGHRRWAAEAQRRAERRPVNGARAVEARARAFARVGDQPREIAALREWLAMMPDDLEPRLRLVERLLAHGRAAEAAEAARESIAAGIADDRLRGALDEATAALDEGDAPAAVARAPAEARPAPRLLGETRGMRLWHWPGAGPGTLVIFTPPTATPCGPREWWGHGPAARLGWEVLVFAAHEPSWFPAAEMAALLPAALAVLPPGPRVTHGIGMGGYGAMKFGRALGAEATVALSPVYSIDPADMPGDPRSRGRFDPQRNAGMAVRPEDLARLPIIVSDPLARIDHLHAQRLAAMPGVRAVPVRRGGPVLPRILAETAQTGPLLAAALQGDAARVAAILKEARRRSPTLRKAVAGVLEARGRAGWAAALRQPLAPAPRPRPAAPVRPEPAPSVAAAGHRLMIQARMLRQQRQHEAEAEVLRQWVAADPAAVDARLTLAHCLQTLGRGEEALAILVDARRAGMRDQRLFAQLVRILRRFGRVAEALEAAETAAAAAPEDAEALAQLGEALDGAKQGAAAEDAFLRALRAQPGHRRSVLGLAALEPDTAEDAPPGPWLATLLAQLARGPTPEAEWLRAIDRLSRGARPGAAIRIAAAASAARPDAIVFPLRHGRILLGAGREEEAARHAEALVAARPDQAQAWLALTDALMVLRRHAEGRDVARRAAAAHPTDATIAARLAAFLLALDDGIAAEREARRAVQLDPAAEGAYLVLIDALRRQERRRDAIALARSALGAVPGSMDIMLRLGRMMLDIEDRAGAVAVFTEACGGARVPRQAWLGLAEALAGAGRAAEAEEVVRRGLAARPEAVELRTMLGQLLLGRGETEAARQALAEAISEDVGSPAVSLAMADALLNEGRRREAVHLLALSAEAAPDHVETSIRLGQLLLDDRRIEEAAALFARITEAAPQLPAGWIGLSDAERLRKRVKPALEAYRRAIAAGADAPALRMLRFRLFGEYDG